MAEQVRQLMALNDTLSEDARNLTQALKVSNKAQGNWGELVLDWVLEASGLREGEQYVVQASHVREDGSRAVPDVIIHLPQQCSLVVDSKVSLTAYEEFSRSEQEAQRSDCAKRHMDSVKAHIRGLSGKNYQTLYALNSMDFVLMFVPVEPAFMLTVSSDQWRFSWKRGSTTSLRGSLDDTRALRHAPSRGARRVPAYSSKSRSLQGMLPFIRERVRLGLRPIAL